MEYALIGLILIILGVGHISKQITIMTEAITDSIESLKNVIDKEESSTDYTIKYDANDIYRLLEDFPDKIAKEIKSELGYRRDEVMGLAYDIRDIKGSLSELEKSLFEIQLKMPD